VRRVDITFLRPQTKANIVYYDTGGSEYVPADSVGERFTFRSPTGLLRYVALYLTGQLSVSNS
jgi:hypothetical protein